MTGEGGIRKPEKGASRTADLRVVRFGRPRQGRLFSAGPRLKHRGLYYPASQSRSFLVGGGGPGRRPSCSVSSGVPREPQVRPRLLGGPSAGSSALTGEWQADSILGIGVDKGPFLCHTTGGSWHMFGFRNRRNAQSARPTALRRSHSERPARRRPDILASRLMVPKR